MQCLCVGEVAIGKLVKLCLFSSANELTDVPDTLFYITAHFFSTWGTFPSAFSISKIIRLKTSTAVCIARILSWECESVSEVIYEPNQAIKTSVYLYLILLSWGLHECGTPGISQFLSLLWLDNPEKNDMETSLNRKHFLYCMRIH